MPPRAEGLTAATCKTKTEPGRYSDGNGLMLIIDKPRADGRAGAKRWCQRLTIGNKRRDLGLGSYPLVSLAAARERAAENARIARGGGDPTVQRDEAPTIPTFAEVAEMKLDQKRKELSNEKHAKQWRSTLEDHAFPVLGDMRVDEIGVDEVLAVLEPIWDKTNETASRLRGRIENVLSYAAARKWRSGLNPAQWRGNLDQLLAMPSKVKPVQHQPALAVRDVPEWFKELRKRRGVSSWCLEFVALTWCRSGEARGAEWREIDLERALWTIPAARTKTSTEHIVPLSSGAISLLRSIPMTSKSGLVFEGARGGMLSDMALSSVMRKLHAEKVEDDGEGWRESQKPNRPAVVHGLRSTGRDWAAINGYPRELAELALGHRIGSKVEQAYSRDSLAERRRAMMEGWSEFLTGTKEGGHLRIVVG